MYYELPIVQIVKIYYCGFLDDINLCIYMVWWVIKL